MPAEIFREHALADRLGLILPQARKAAARKAFRVELDDERAHVRRVAVMVGAALPELGAAEGLGQRLEAPAGAEPGEPVAQMGDLGAELAREIFAQQGVWPVGADDEMGAA